MAASNSIDRLENIKIKPLLWGWKEEQGRTCVHLTKVKALMDAGASHWQHLTALPWKHIIKP